MNWREAMHWLDAHGGRWCVRATQTTCFLLATLGPVTVRSPIGSLDAASVDAALVDAVTELQQREGERDPS